MYIPVIATPVQMDAVVDSVSDAGELLNPATRDTLIQNSKRAVTRSRPINLCPRGSVWNTFFWSQCERRQNPQAYSGYCLTGSPYEINFDDVKSFTGECFADELCVDSTNPPGHLSTAYCISTDDFAKYALTQVQKEEGQMTVDLARLGVSLAGGASEVSEYAVEAVMTGTKTQESIFAKNLEIQAQKASFVHGGLLWMTVDDGLGRCSGCAGVGIGMVPNGTQRLLLNTGLAAGVTAGNIWLTAWKPGG